MNWYAFYVLGDPDGEIVSVLELSQEDADEMLVADPALGYVQAPGNIDPALYYVNDGLLFLRAAAGVTPEPPAAPVKTWAFFDTTDPTGEILSVLKGTEEDAELSILDVDISYLEGPEGMAPADYYVTGGVLTARPTMSLTVNKTTITADGVDTATISGIPSNTTATLLATADFAEVSELVSGSTTLRTRHKIRHVIQLRKLPYRVAEVAIHGV